MFLFSDQITRLRFMIRWRYFWTYH